MLISPQTQRVIAAVSTTAASTTAASAPQPQAATPEPQAASPALRLLQHEADVRRLDSEPALLFHLVNSPRSLVRYGSALVWRRQRSSHQLQIAQVADLPDVNPDAPLLQALAARLNTLDAQGHLAKPLAWLAGVDAAQADGHAAITDTDTDTDTAALLAGYPFQHLLWLPLHQRPVPAGSAAPAPDAGVLFARAHAFSVGEHTLLARLAETYAHAWAALRAQRAPQRPFAHGLPLQRRWLLGLALGLCAAALLPVRLSVMAPVEVVAADPLVLTAPIAGVVKAVLVPPNSSVRAGQALLQFEDIQPRNEMVLAQQRLAVARARAARTSAAAFRDPVAAHDMAAAQAELDLARVSHAYAVEVLQRTRVLTPSAGLVIYTDRRDWEGRAVQVGEEILQVADPSRVALRVDLPTANRIDLQPGSELRIYLDNAPLGGLQAQLRSVSYSPRSQPGGSTSYTVMADPLPDGLPTVLPTLLSDGLPNAVPGTRPDAPTSTLPRIGARGTARLYGDRVPLIVQLLRRPVAATRQFIGL